ncbi:MAG: carbohydrate kinase family protein [Chloroflexi bacterium]|nr:carbohydrate kinase family protein [Chloroflexota bacterium]
MAACDVVVAGHICLDIIPQFPPGQLPGFIKPGSLHEIDPVVLSTGGTVSNAGRNLHRLGIETRLMGKVGRDPFGEIVLDLIRADDPALAEDMIIMPGETTSYTVVISPPGADRSFLHCPGANHTVGPRDVDYTRVHGARLFHFGYPPLMRRMYSDDGAELAEIFRRVQAGGVITSLDMAMPDLHGPSGQVNWRRVLENTLPHVDLFLPSLDELLFMLHPGAPEPTSDAVVSEIAAEVLALGAHVSVIKLGSRGLYLRTGAGGLPGSPDPGWRNRELWIPCFVPKVLAGTTGSGDATIAGFIAALLRGQTAEEALIAAVAVGACNVEAPDALSGVCSWDMTQARVRSGWAHAALTIQCPGWTWDARYQLWRGPADQG